SRGRNRSIGSTYRSPMRRPRWSTRPSWSVPTPPASPTTSPRVTGCPSRTPTDERNEYDVRRSPSWARVTCSVPATEPAKLTTPSPAARTGVPGAAAKSTPRCPAAYSELGASNGRTTGPSTGRIHPRESSGAARAAPAVPARTAPTRTTSTATKNARPCGAPRAVRMANPVVGGRHDTGKRRRRCVDPTGVARACQGANARGRGPAPPRRPDRSVADWPGLALGLGQPTPQLEDRLGVDLADPALGDAEQTADLGERQAL